MHNNPIKNVMATYMEKFIKYGIFKINYSQYQGTNQINTIFATNIQQFNQEFNNTFQKKKFINMRPF